MSRLAALLASAALAGCIEIPGPDGCDPLEDADGDGWTCDARSRAADCDDDDATVNPGALDLPGDEIDQDCSGDAATTAPSAVAVGAALTGPTILTADHEIVLRRDGARMPHSIYRRDLDPADPDAQLLLIPDGDDLEGGMGIAIYPTFHTTDATALNGGAYNVDAQGPARVRAFASWERLTEPRLLGQTMLTVYPDGRVLRLDTVQVQDSVTGTGLYFSSFNGFDARRFVVLELSTGVTDPLDLVADGTVFAQAVPEDGWTCLSGVGGHAAGMSWRPDQAAAGLRVQRRGDKIALEADWVRAGTDVPAADYTAVTLVALTRSGGCDAIAAAAADLASPITVRVDEGEVTWFPAEGLHRIVTDGAPFVELELEGTPQTTSVAVEAEVAVRDGVTVWRNGERLIRGRDVVVQLAEGFPDTTTVWFAIPLEDGDVIRIAPPGQEPPE